MPNVPQKQADGRADEPQLVLNAETGRYVNITPLFKRVNYAYNGDFSEVSRQLNQTIRFVSLNTEQNSHHVSYLNTLELLYELKDIFESMTEFKQS